MTGFIDIVIAFIGTLLFPKWISDESLSFSNSLFSVVLFVLLFLLLHRERKREEDRRLSRLSLIPGFLFSFMTACGYSLNNLGTVSFRSVFLSVITYTWILSRLLCLLWRALRETEKRLSRRPETVIGRKVRRFIGWAGKHPAAIGAFLFLCWMPCFLADFPGGFRYDAAEEFAQLSEGYNGSFPLLHTVIITRLMDGLYRITGSYNTGVAVYVLLQMVLIAAMYSHMFGTFIRKGINRTLIACLIVFTGLFPVIQILAVQEVRDVMFASLLVYTVFLFYLLITDREGFLGSLWKPVLLGFMLVLTLLARNNNAGPMMIVLVVAVCTLIWLLCRKISLKGATAFAVTGIGAYLLIGALLTALCRPLVPAEQGGALSIMSQPLARAYVMEPETWMPEEAFELNNFMNLDGMEYVPENADNTKARIRYDTFGNFAGFFFRMAKKHPGCFIDAVLENTKYMWFPASVVDGYNRSGIPSYEGFDKCYYSIKAHLDEPAEHRNLLPKVLDFYTSIGLRISFEKIPVVSMLFSIGFQYWMLLNTFFYLIYRKKKELLLPVGMLLLYMLISSLVPLIVLRYFASVFLAIPLIVCITLQPEAAEH